MKIRTLSLILLAATSVIFQSCQPADKNNQTSDSAKADRSNGSKAGKTGRPALENEIQSAMFIETAAQDGMLNIALGELAAEKAKHPGVRKFGNLMVQYHSEMNNRLKALAMSKGLKLPISLPQKQSKQLRQMREMKTAYFERLYMRMMIQYHNKHIDLFKGAGNSPDTAISNFSRRYLPVLEKYRKHALKVRGQLN